MADASKHLHINGGNLISDLKRLFSLRTKRTRLFAYGFFFAFIAFTFFLAFNPSPNPSSPWFSNIFSTTGFSTSNPLNSTTSSSSSSKNGSFRSQFSSVYSYFFTKNSSQPVQNSTSVSFSSSPTIPIPIPSTNYTSSGSQNATIQVPKVSKDLPIVKNQTQAKTDESPHGGKVGDFQPSNQTTIGSNPANQTLQNSAPIKPSSSSSSSGGKNATGNGEKRIAEKGGGQVKNLTSSLVKKQNNNGTNVTNSGGIDVNNLVKSLVNCDLFDGDWVRDESYPLYKPGSCSLIDEQFNCFLNGRPDMAFQKLKWKPNGCTLPRLDGSHMLELLRGKRLVFVGDSLNRNMWESLVCILRNSVKDQTKVYEASGRHHFRTEPSYSFVFKDYDFTVEFFVSPFLVRESEVKDKKGMKKETLRLDLIGNSAYQYKNADIVIFNTGHWWTHEKTSKGKDYYQEGSNVYGELNVLEAFRKAMTTWGRWVDTHINPAKTLVFFRGYSASHFSGGQWNSGGQCDNEIEPIKNKTYLSPYPVKMEVLEKVFRGMKTRVSYLNITRLTDYRKDGHPSIYRKQQYTDQEKKSPLQFQDCSHWCLPGVPDAWNELLYAELLVKQYQQQQQKGR